MSGDLTPALEAGDKKAPRQGTRGQFVDASKAQRCRTQGQLQLGELQIVQLSPLRIVPADYAAAGIGEPRGAHVIDACITPAVYALPP